MNTVSTKPADVARQWWQSMMFSGAEEDSKRRGGQARAALAALRRADSPIKALAIPATLDLYRRLRSIDPEIALDRVAVLAVALANLRPEAADKTLPSVSRAIGRPSFDDADNVKLSESRFRRLLQAEEEELLDAFRRLVRLMGGRLRPDSLADAILNWGDAVRQRWIFDYYAVAIAAPAASETTMANPNEDQHG